MNCRHGVGLGGGVICPKCAIESRGFPHRSLHDEAVYLITQFEPTQPLLVIDEAWRAYHVLPDDLVEVPL